MDHEPFHLYGTTPDAPDAPATDCISVHLMNRLIVTALVILAVFTFQEWRRQVMAEENATLRTALTERDAAIALITGEGGVADAIVERLKAEGAAIVGTQALTPTPVIVIPPRPQPAHRGKPNPKLSGQVGDEVYSGGQVPLLPDALPTGYR